MVRELTGTAYEKESTPTQLRFDTALAILHLVRVSAGQPFGVTRATSGP